MHKLVLLALTLLSMADECDGPQKKIVEGDGNVGYDCFHNDTCNDDALCVVWKKQDGSKQSVCAAPKELVVGGFLHPKPCEECPKLHCPPPTICPPAPVCVKTVCPKVPEGPCPECRACEPGWKRPK